MIYSEQLWNKLLQINQFLTKIHFIMIYPFKAFSKRIFTRLPFSKFFFRPLILNEFYMALGLWEPYVKNVFKPRSGQNLLNVGAHIGYYVHYVSQFKGIAKIIAIEPDPFNLQILLKNIQGLENVILIPYAVSNSIDRKRFIVSQTSQSSKLLKSENKKHKLIEVDVVTLDYITNKLEIKKYDWALIDIEDGILDCFKGGKQTLQQVDKIICEINKKDIGYIIRENFLVKKLSESYYYGEKLKKTFL